MPQCVSLSLFRFGPVSARLWVFGQMALARTDFARMREVEFVKLCGSGTGEGFTPRPNTAVWAILAGWPDEATARRMTAEAPVYRRWRAHAAEAWSLFLSPSRRAGNGRGARPSGPSRPRPRAPSRC